MNNGGVKGFTCCTISNNDITVTILVINVRQPTLGKKNALKKGNTAVDK